MRKGNHQNPPQAKVLLNTLQAAGQKNKRCQEQKETKIQAKNHIENTNAENELPENNGSLQQMKRRINISENVRTHYRKKHNAEPTCRHCGKKFGYMEEALSSVVNGHTRRTKYYCLKCVKVLHL